MQLWSLGLLPACAEGIYIEFPPMLRLYHSNQKTTKNSAELFLNGNKIYL